jgi:hypothetical protein
MAIMLAIGITNPAPNPAFAVRQKRNAVTSSEVFMVNYPTAKLNFLNLVTADEGRVIALPMRNLLRHIPRMIQSFYFSHF